MPGLFNDVNAWINSAGNFTLGNGGAPPAVGGSGSPNEDDGRAQTGFPYAKNDIFFDYPLPLLIHAPGTAAVYQAVPFGANARALNSGAGAQGFSILLSSAGVTDILQVNASMLFRTFIGNLAQGTSITLPQTSPKGMLLRSIMFAYRPITTNLNTAPTVTAWIQSIPDQSTATGGIVVAGTNYGGTVTYQNPIGTTITTLYTTAITSMYVAMASWAAPQFINTYNQDLFVELAFGITPTSGTVEIRQIQLRCAMALY